MKKGFIAAIMSVMLAVLLLGCGTDKGGMENPAADNSKQPLQELTIGLMPDTDSVPLIIAQEKGYFDEEGLKVNLQPFKSAMDRDSAMQSGNLDGAISDMLAVAFSKSGGFDMKVTSFTDGSYKLIAGKEETAVSVQELQGKDVAISKNTIIEYVTDQILTSQNMGDNAINKVVIPQIPTRLEMLQNGKLAAATLPEPMGSIAISNGCHFITGSDELGINPGVFMFTAKTVEGKKAELQAFYRAYNKAVKYLNDTDTAEYMDMVIEKSGFPAAAKDALKLPKYHEAALPTEKDVVDCINWMNKKELIKQNYSYDDIVVDINK